MIAGFNVNSFVDSTIEIYKRDEISDEGAASTVNKDMFVEWVKESFCPVLGNYADCEPNSIVVMDNTSTHMCEQVRRLIEGQGAYLLYTAPYSPNLVPIEYGFNVYKAYLKHY